MLEAHCKSKPQFDNKTFLTVGFFPIMSPTKIAPSLGSNRNPEIVPTSPPLRGVSACNPLCLTCRANGSSLKLEYAPSQASRFSNQIPSFIVKALPSRSQSIKSNLYCDIPSPSHQQSTRRPNRYYRDRNACANLLDSGWFLSEIGQKG